MVDRMPTLDLFCLSNFDTSMIDVEDLTSLEATTPRIAPVADVIGTSSGNAITIAIIISFLLDLWELNFVGSSCNSGKNGKSAAVTKCCYLVMAIAGGKTGKNGRVGNSTNATIAPTIRKHGHRSIIPFTLLTKQYTAPLYWLWLLSTEVKMFQWFVQSQS